MSGRYGHPPDPARTTRFRPLSTPTTLAGANGIRLGQDGHLYVVSAFGSRLARIDVVTGVATVLSERHNGAVTPDDLAFGRDGSIYLSDYMTHRVCRYRDRATEVIADVKLANGICTYGDRLFVGEYHDHGRLLEIFQDGRPPRVVASGLLGPNGMTVGPDRMIYVVQVYAGDVVRVPIDGGTPERLIGGLHAPTSARVAPDGTVYISQPAGDIVTVDPRTGESAVVAHAPPGIDNLEVDAHGRLYLSYYDSGAVVEVLADQTLRYLVPPGLIGPFGVCATDSGVLMSDGMRLLRIENGRVEVIRTRLDAGYPGFIQGLGAHDDVLYVTTTAGELARYDLAESTVLLDGLNEPKGVAVRPDGGIVVAVAGEGTVLLVTDDGARRPLAQSTRPVGIATDFDGACYVTDEADGSLIRLSADGERHDRLLGDLDHPQGVTVVDDHVYIVEAGAKRVVGIGRRGGTPFIVADGLPLGAPNGGVRLPIPGLLESNPYRAAMGGPIGPFAGLAATTDGSLYFSGDETGVVGLLEPQP